MRVSERERERDRERGRERETERERERERERESVCEVICMTRTVHLYSCDCMSNLFHRETLHDIICVYVFV